MDGVQLISASSARPHKGYFTTKYGGSAQVFPFLKEVASLMILLSVLALLPKSAQLWVPLLELLLLVFSAVVFAFLQLIFFHFFGKWISSFSSIVVVKLILQERNQVFITFFFNNMGRWRWKRRLFWIKFFEHPKW